MTYQTKDDSRRNDSDDRKAPDKGHPDQEPNREDQGEQQKKKM